MESDFGSSTSSRDCSLPLSDIRISVVVPAFGVHSTLAAAVNSVHVPNDRSVEVVIVDDGSRDGTSQVADSLAQMADVTVVHRLTAGGPTVARNAGLAVARGEYVLFLDGDDSLTPNGLDYLLRGFSDSRVVATLGRFQAVDAAGSEIDIGTWAKEQLRPVVRRRGRFVASPQGLTPEAILTRLVTPPPGAILIRRETLLSIGGYDERVHRSEDVDLLVRLATVGQLGVINETVLLYQRAPSQRSAAVRRRQFGRQWTLARLIVLAPSRAAGLERARGAAAHHLDRATTRWQFGQRSFPDMAVVARSLALAGALRLLGWFVAGWPRGHRRHK